MTQAELGAALDWGDKGANRLAQYETNYRVPRKDLVTEINMDKTIGAAIVSKSLFTGIIPILFSFITSSF